MFYGTLKTTQMKSIYLDIGNSSLKLAEKQNGDWFIVYRESLNEAEKLIDFVKKNYPGSHMIVSSVRADISEIITSNFNDTKITLLSSLSIPPAMLNYGTPKTLGLDRFLACLAAWKMSLSDVVVVDTGSACTIDFMSKAGVFMGGIITPGLGMIRDSITAKLPELPVPEVVIPEVWPGKTTAESIQWGAYWGYAEMVKRFLDKYLEKHPYAAIYLTGGDAVFLSEQLKSVYDVEVREFLQFEGMSEFYKMERL